jgi:hypothetical protein
MANKTEGVKILVQDVMEDFQEPYADSGEIAQVKRSMPHSWEMGNRW